MNAGEICNRDVVIVRRETGLVEAARLMGEHHVGSLVVVLESEGKRVPVVAANGALAGILTMDGLVELVAEELGDFARTVGRERLRETRGRP